MIGKREKNAFKKILGKPYTPYIVSVLQERGVKDASGKDYSLDYIRMVFNGKRDCVEIEEAIIEAVAREKKYQEDLKQKKQELLKTA